MPVTATQKLDKKALRADIERKLLTEKDPRRQSGASTHSGPRPCRQHPSDKLLSGGEIRLHGRGGQGAVMAAKMLASAFARENKAVASFPMYGFERRGMPVVAFTRFAEQPIREKTQIYHPDCLMVVDPSLLAITSLFDGLKPGGILILNSAKPLHRPPSANLTCIGRINATGIALEEIGKDIPNTCLLGALAATTGWLSLDSVLSGLSEYLEGDLLTRNIRNATRGFHEVEVQSWQA
jgi:2-oxoacid:acceptor oxidoreductase gamma subunit (pyruvate/2-ketoisovalerate family)